jgi:hypothetical protein
MADIIEKGMISFLLEHADKNWTTNDQGYVFDPIEQQGIGILASKYPDGTLEIDVNGPLGKHVNFRQPTPQDNELGVMVMVRWRPSQITLLLNRQRVATEEA